MKRSRFLAVIAAAAIALTPMVATATTPPPSVNHSGASPVGVWLVMGCAASLIWAAWIANVTHNRQLTAAEASFCGLGYLLRMPPK